MHIYVLRCTVPLSSALIAQKQQAPRYTFKINLAAYLTASLSAMVLCTLYYFAAAPLLTGYFFIDAVCFSLLVMEIKGQVLRLPLMNWLLMRDSKHPAPLHGMGLQMLDQWLAGFALGFVIVALCPVRLY